MKKVLLFVVMSMFAFSVMAQTTVKGKVMTEKKKAISGAVIKANTVTATTDAKGKFEITVPAGVTSIEVSATGYKTRTLSVDKKKMKIKMLPK
jgi:hypothetical protein